MPEDKAKTTKQPTKKSATATDTEKPKKVTAATKSVAPVAAESAAPAKTVAKAAAKASAKTPAKTSAKAEPKEASKAAPKAAVKAPAKSSAKAADKTLSQTIGNAEAADPVKPVAPAKTAAKAAAKPKTAAAVKKVQDKPAAPSPEERQRWIATAAYHRAEKRGFAPGFEHEDWREAEAEIDALIGKA